MLLYVSVVHLRISGESGVGQHPPERSLQTLSLKAIVTAFEISSCRSTVVSHTDQKVSNIKTCFVRGAQINGENVSTATHSHTVQLIRSSGNAICLKIITPRRRRLDRLRAPERAVVVSRDARQPLTATDNERTVNKTSSCVAGHSGESGGHGHLPTARSMPDLTAAVSHDQQRNDDDRRPTAAANAKVQTSSSVDYRDRVLYELTNQLRPLPAVRQPLSVNGSTDNDGTTSESRKSGDETSSAQRRPVPPPRGPSLSSRPHGSTPAVASQAMSTGSEFKELLVVSGQTRTSSPGDGHGRESRTDSTSTPAARSVISGEHLVLPSQLKKVHRSATDQHASKQVGDDDIKNRTGLQPSSLGGAVASTSHHAVVEHRSPAPKRPAPPPPTTTPVSNGEVNFLVMAEQARRQYIMSKLTTGTLTQNEHLATDSVGLSKAVNGSATSFQTNGRSHEFSHTADEKSTEQQHMPKERHLQTIQSSQANEKGLSDSRTVTVNGSSQAESVGGSVRQPCESVDTLATGPPPAIPPKRRQRHSSRVEIHNSNETSNTVGRVMSTVDDRGTDGGQTSTHELADTQLSENTIVSVTRDSSVAQDSSEQRRRSNAKLTRGKNVVVRRSGLSRPAAEDGLTVNGISSHRSRDDAEQTQQQQQVMSSVEEVGILPPPPDFAD